MSPTDPLASPAAADTAPSATPGAAAPLSSAAPLSTAERRVLEQFGLYLMSPYRMLCFSGPGFEQHRAALETLTEKRLLTREKRAGAYSLTPKGYRAMARYG